MYDKKTKLILCQCFERSSKKVVTVDANMYYSEMTFVDEITLHACAGRGGDGVVRWHKEKGKPKGGPSGGNGGDGGNVIIRGVRDLSLLGKYRGNPKFAAGDGVSGGDKKLHGANGADVIIDVPIGSVVTLAEKNETFEILSENEEVTILRGGRGGLGNEHFKGSKNVRPRESTSGKSGECDTLYIELQLIADAGLVGFPNEGKSTLLNTVTNAQAKTGDYEFTTLEPNLGSLFGYIIADIPGLIEGASEGRGLGYKFLRHIRRTKALVVCISANRDSVVEPYKAIFEELRAYDPTLLELPRIGVLTKRDLVSEEESAAKLEEFRGLCDTVVAVSVHDTSSIKAFQDTLIRFLRTQEGERA